MTLTMLDPKNPEAEHARTDELARQIRAEPTTSRAEYALKLSVSQNFIHRHGNLTDDLDDPGWMNRVLVRLFNNAIDRSATRAR